MGMNNQPYLGPFFAQLRNQLTANGQKVEPIAPAAKTKQYERKYSPDVVIHCGDRAFLKCGGGK